MRLVALRVVLRREIEDNVLATNVEALNDGSEGEEFERRLRFRLCRHGYQCNST